ncbi:MAG: hypothetical protein IT246_04765 [Bacteroidia bacterium]|nr:hypothetical protein [Bacteroidia bacterium]
MHLSFPQKINSFSIVSMAILLLLALFLCNIVTAKNAYGSKNTYAWSDCDNVVSCDETEHDNVEVDTKVMFVGLRISNYELVNLQIVKNSKINCNNDKNLPIKPPRI